MQTTTEAERTSAVRLAMIPGIGPLMQRSLLEYFGSAVAILNASPSELRRIPGIGPQLSRAITSANEKIDVDAELQRCKKNQIHLAHIADADYPRILKEIHDPPSVLFVRGNVLEQDALSVAIVGTRHATQYGKAQAMRLAGSLARAGITIVSGLARGIDIAAHQGALEAGGRTIAVLASGVLHIYPPEHQKIADEIPAAGALISESSSLTKPRPGSFPRRNRLITGISLGVVVVEAAERSGAILTANHAMEQGREIFAVPGRIDSRVSKGCHRLLRDGAKLVESADDVLEELGPLVEASTQANGQTVRRPAELQLNDQERKVLNQISSETTNVEQLVHTTGLPIHRILSTISVLEMRRLVKRKSGTTVARI